MPGPFDFDDLIGQTYDAALGTMDWTVPVERLMQAVGGTTAVLRWRGRPAATAVTINGNPASHALYDAYYRDLDPLWPMIRQRTPGAVVDDRTLVTEQALQQTEFYNDFMRPNGLQLGLSWYTLDAAAQPVALYIARARGDASYAGEALALLQCVAPHLDRAIRIESLLAAAVARQIPVPGSPALTPRERDCLALIAHGASSKGIARRLTLSVHTVNKHVEAAMRKLQASSRSQAVVTALALGLIGG
jgi:DNA-binding CsgD family transcriptional regulator